jgi:hypothetical protein
MWTIDEFSTYEMIYSWSMHGKLICPYCMENNKAFTLTNSGIMSFFLLPREDLNYSSNFYP